MTGSEIVQLVLSALTIPTLLAVGVLTVRIGRWTGVIDTEIQNTKNWQQQHERNHHL